MRVKNLPNIFLNYRFTSFSNPTQVSLLDEVEAKVMQVMTKQIKNNSQIITRSSRFSDLGIDSLDSVELVVEIEREFGLDLSNDEAH